MVGPRQPYDRDDDLYLAKYIATYNPSKPGRMGNALYLRLVEDAEGKWPWSKRHSWQSWRERYKNNEHKFDTIIRQYQKRKGILPGGGGAERVVSPGRSQKENGRQNDSILKAGNTKTITDASSSSQTLQDSKHPSTKSPSRKNPASTNYSKAEEEESMSDAPIPASQDATSQGHKHVARKTARKTVAPANRSEAEEDINDIMTSGHENTPHGKRKPVDGTDTEGEAKRRRIHNDTRSTTGTGEPPGRSQNGNRLEHAETDVEKPGGSYTNHEIISPADQVLVDRAGLQFFIQSMAQNHGVSEDWVRRVYEERRDLQGTDRIIAKMRDAAERAFEEAIELEKKREEKAEAISASTSRRLSASRLQAVGSSAQSSPNRREVDLSALSAPRDRPFVSRPHAELLYTPADEDSTLARVRNQYVPPSASRAARYVRTRARRSSGMTGSPLNINAEGMRGGQEDNEKEEEEVSMTLAPSHVLVDSVDSSASEHVEWDIPSSPPASAFAEQLDGAENSTDSAAQEGEETMDSVNSQFWTAEEDKILQDGEDEEAIKAIAERKGKMAVKWRLVELNDDDLIL